MGEREIELSREVWYTLYNFLVADSPWSGVALALGIAGGKGSLRVTPRVITHTFTSGIAGGKGQFGNRQWYVQGM